MNQTNPVAPKVTHHRRSAGVARPASFVSVPHAAQGAARRPIVAAGRGPRGRELSPANARRLLLDLAGLEIDDMRRHHVDLVAATADLALAAGLDWPWTHDDPTAAVLRALSKIALLAPEATSPRAAALRQQLANTDTVVPR